MAASEESLPIFRADVNIDVTGLSYEPPRLHARLHPAELSWRLVKAALGPLLVNLMLLPESEDPELIRHTRMAWRRFRRALQLCRTVCNLNEPPDLSSFQFLMHQLGLLRDIDVARLDVLDRIKTRFSLKYQAQGTGFNELLKSLEMAAHFQRLSIRAWLLDASMQDTVWALTLWAIALYSDAKTKPEISNRPICLDTWARVQISILQKKLKRSQAYRRTPQTRHRTRIWAKRLHYAIEDLQDLLHSPPHQWLKKAKYVQRKEGEYRDLQVTVELAERYGPWSLAHKLRSFL